MACKKDRQGMVASNGSESEWLKILSRLDTDSIPEGYETSETICKKMGRTLAVTRVRLKQAYDNGLVERKRIRVNGTATYIYKIK